MQRHNLASLLGDQLATAVATYVLNYFNLSVLVVEDFSLPYHFTFACVTQGMDAADSRLGAFRSPARILQSPGRLPPRGPHMTYTGIYNLNAHYYGC